MAFSRSLILVALFATLSCLASGMSYPRRHYSRFLPVNVDSFSWEDCGDETHAATVTKFSLSPDPVIFRENCAVDFEATLSREVDSPLTLSVNMSRLIGAKYVHIPCLKQMGSCTYNDFCTILEKFCKKDECRCPFKKGTYNYSDVVVAQMGTFDEVKSVGSYDVKLDMSDSEGKVACLRMKFEIAPKPKNSKYIGY